jgi:hypothetical protein
MATDESKWLALSMRQPWYWAVEHAGKRIENRDWATHYRGPLILHAARGCEPAEYEEAVGWMVSRSLAVRHGTPANRVNATLPAAPPLERMRRGGFGLIVEVTAVMPRGDAVEQMQLRGHAPRVDMRWKMPDRCGFVLTRVQALPWAPGRGMPGLFPVGAEVVAALGLPADRQQWRWP